MAFPIRAVVLEIKPTKVEDLGLSWAYLLRASVIVLSGKIDFRSV